MYVTHGSFAAPAPAIRDFFWLYHTYSLLRGGFYNASSGFGLWAKTLRGQIHEDISLPLLKLLNKNILQLLETARNSLTLNFIP